MSDKGDWYVDKVLAAALLSFFMLVLPVAADDAINPMVWSQNQWRSDLFGEYARHHQKRGARRYLDIRVETVTVEKIDAAEMIAREQSPRRARLILIGEANQRTATIRHVLGAERKCQGMLVLTWDGNRALSRCHRTNTNRMLRP